MGINVRVRTTPNLGARFGAAVRQGMLAGGEAVLEVSDVLAPREPTPRHGVHMIDTGFVRVVPGAAVDTIVIGYGAFWAVWQHEDLTYNHPDGGEAKFLEKAILAGGGDAVMEKIAAAIRREFV